jgi:hypothetical protein
LGLFVFALLKNSLRTNTDADKPSTGSTFSGVNDDKGFLLLAHKNQQLNKRQEYIVCEHRVRP